MRALLATVVLAFALPALAQKKDGGTDVLVKGGEVLGTGAAKVTKGIGNALSKEGQGTGEAVGEGAAELTKGLLNGVTKGLGGKQPAAATPRAPGEVVLDDGLTFLGARAAKATRRPDGVRIEFSLAKELSGALVLVAYDAEGHVVGRASRDSQKLLDGDSLTFVFGAECDLTKAAWFKLQ
ncbi:MAG: hypothetical protein QM817_27755 [Archangium sp.]